MSQPATILRLRRDRERLVGALCDYETGKFTHLTEKERDVLMASIKQRIAELDVKIAEHRDQ